MELTTEQARALIGLACQIARADGIVTEEEQGFLLHLTQRFAAHAVSVEELLGWLESGAPEHGSDQLPKSLGQMFFYEAMQLAEADGELDDRELELLDAIMHRFFAEHPEGVPIARIGLIKQKPK